MTGPRVVFTLFVVIVCVTFVGASADDRDVAVSRWQGERTPVGSARAALGGDARLRQVRSLILQGTLTSGFDAVTGKPSTRVDGLEIRMRLPDYFLRIEEQGVFRRQTGFDGSAPIESTVVTGGEGFVASDSRPDVVLKNAKRQFAELALGLLAETQTAVALRVERPAEGTRRLRVSGSDDFAATLHLDAVTSAPQSLRFWKKEIFPRPITEAEKRARVVPPLPQPETVEVTLLFEDRREVEGVLLPFRIRRVARNVTVEDIQVRRYILNAPHERLHRR